MRIHIVRKSRKDQGRCSKCGTPLPVGSAYRWIKFRYGPKRVRCMRNDCRFRGSDLTTSDKMSDLYSAQEQAEDALGELRNNLPDMEPEGIAADLDGLAETISESMDLVEGAADGYEESAANVDEYFPGSYQVDEITEKSENARQYYDELDYARGQAEDAAQEIISGEWTMSQVEAALDDIDNHIQSLEII